MPGFFHLISSSIHAVVNSKVYSHFAKLHTFTTFLLTQSVAQLGYFSLATVNTSAVNIHVQMFLQHTDFMFSGYTGSDETAESNIYSSVNLPSSSISLN